MNRITTTGQTPRWQDTARQLIGEVVTLFASFAGHAQGSLRNDINKLLRAANRLEKLLQENPGPAANPSRLWHELRNIIGTLLGYAELVEEECSPVLEKQQYDRLKQIITLCHLVLNSEHQEQAVEITASLPARGQESGTVLVVDDQPESRELLERYLLQQGYDVEQASTAEEMMAILNTQTIDLLLLDLLLGEVDGFDLLKTLKTNDQWRSIPVIVVSGFKDTERVIRCIEAGAEDYLFKPFNPVLLAARIRSGIQRKRWDDLEKQYRHELELNQRFIRNIFGRYLSEEIVDTLLENPDGLDLGGSQRRVTVMMADIRGFTAITEQLPPHRVVKLLNNYLGAMTEIIMRHNGTVDEFIGDAILAIFGAPISRHDDTDRAICCAIAMQKAMKTINALNRQENLPEIEMGISLNTGLVIAGNIGSEKRAKYGVVGHTVNQTARIEEHCPPGKILIAESTLNHCSSFLSIAETQTIKAKGILREISIHTLENIDPVISMKYQDY